MRCSPTWPSAFSSRSHPALAPPTDLEELFVQVAAAYAAGARLAAYIWRNDLGFIMPPAVARKRAYELAGRALSLDPTNPVSFAVLAQLQVTDRQFDQALTSARRAVEVAPGDAAAQATLALVLAAAGEHAQLSLHEQAHLLARRRCASHGLLQRGPPRGKFGVDQRDQERARCREIVVDAWPGDAGPRGKGREAQAAGPLREDELPSRGEQARSLGIPVLGEGGGLDPGHTATLPHRT